MKTYFQKAAALGCFCVAVTLTACGGGQGLQSDFNDTKTKDTKIKETENGSGETKGDFSPMAWEAYADTPIDLDWYVNFSWFETGWGENMVSRKITEETGVSVNFITPAGSETEKMNSMIASDTLPDIITLGWWETQAQQMVEYDMVYALNELADQYDPYFYEVIDPDTASWYTKEDGNIYCYPSSSYTPADYETCDNIGSNENFLVRKDIYEAIGSPDMTTPEGFCHAVKEAVRLFPEVEGYPLIPIGADEFRWDGCNSFDKYLKDFLAVPNEKDGKAYDRTLDEDYIAWLKVFRQLAEEGYLVNDIFVDRRTQIEEKLARGRYFCMFYQGQDMLDQQKTRYKEDPDSVYIAVEGPKNSRGDDPVLPGTSINGWTVTFISKNCRNPERAIAFLSYLISEHGQKLIYLGVEGEMYDMVDGTAVLYPKVQQLLDTDREEYDRIYGADDAYWMLQDNVMQMKWGRALPDAERQIKEWSYPYSYYAGQYEVNYASGTEAANINAKVQQVWGKTLPQLLLADSEEEFDRIFQEFVEKRASYGYEKVLEENTRQIALLKEKLGMAE